MDGTFIRPSSKFPRLTLLRWPFERQIFSHNGPAPSGQSVSSRCAIVHVVNMPALPTIVVIPLCPGIVPIFQTSKSFKSHPFPLNVFPKNPLSSLAYKNDAISYMSYNGNGCISPQQLMGDTQQGSSHSRGPQVRCNTRFALDDTN